MWFDWHHDPAPISRDGPWSSSANQHILSFKESQWNVWKEKGPSLLSPHLSSTKVAGKRTTLPLDGILLRYGGCSHCGRWGGSGPWWHCLNLNLTCIHPPSAPFSYGSQNTPMWFKPVWIGFSVTCSIRSSNRYSRSLALLSFINKTCYLSRGLWLPKHLHRQISWSVTSPVE